MNFKAQVKRWSSHLQVCQQNFYFGFSKDNHSRNHFQSSFFITCPQFSESSTNKNHPQIIKNKSSFKIIWASFLAILWSRWLLLASVDSGAPNATLSWFSCTVGCGEWLVWFGESQVPWPKKKQAPRVASLIGLRWFGGITCTVYPYICGEVFFGRSLDDSSSFHAEVMALFFWVFRKPWNNLKQKFEKVLWSIG